jgi:asparagine synthase (glutamine-hydrolysing)
MCGIVGIVRFDGAPVDQSVVAAMSRQLVHRGPDGDGVWIGQAVAFGHRRLSIIDLAGSPQPMTSADGRTHVTFNGEILNYKEIRRTIPYPYATAGDTEVLLAAYQAYGPEMVRLLEGQFAFAIHDAVEQTTWLFRDRLGILPLYYWSDSAHLLFASEAKALLPVLPSAPRVDTYALQAYLAHRSVPSPHTLFEGIRKLAPGHMLRASRGGDVSVRRWWTLPDEIATPREGLGLKAVSAVSKALRQSVAANLVADVPVGAYLSGGLDSSLIVALMAERMDPGTIHTFSAGFGDPSFDETMHARRVSEHIGTNHHEVRVGPADFERLWPKLTWHRDAPLSEPADVAVFRLAQTARDHVKVVLSGEGSDELFAGYPKYRFAQASVLAARLPAKLRRDLSGFLQALLPARWSRARVALRALGAEDYRAILEAWFAPFTAEEIAELLQRTCRRAGAAIPDSRGDPVRRMLYVDCHAWLSDNLLERGDRMSMAASLELRPPFLHPAVVDTAFSLPSNVKLRKRCSKWVVKEVARGLLPDDIVDRGKSGFRVPLGSWFRGALGNFARERLLDPGSFATQYFDRPGLERLLSSHARGRRDENIRIWTLVGLEIWNDQFIRRVSS